MNGPLTQRYHWTTKEVGIVREHYAKMGPREVLALLPGRTLSGVYQRGVILGLRSPSRPEKRHRWPAPTPDQDEAIRTFYAGGIKRGDLDRFADRLGCDTADPDHFTAGQLAVLLGVDGKTVTRWIKVENLPGKKRGTARTEAQGGDMWWIARKNLKTWIGSHAQLIDLRKVDRFWFIDFAFGMAA